MRRLTNFERTLIRQFADRLDDAQKRQLLMDAEKATADEVLADGSIVRFYVEGYVHPTYRGQHPLPVEGVVLDADGAIVSVLLHLDENDRLYELELVRYADGELIGPDWQTFRFV